LLLSAFVTGLAILAGQAEAGLFGQAWLEPIVLAILFGTIIRSFWTPSPKWRPGIAFSAKPLLEVAVVLLGASISTSTILSAGPGLLAGILAVVALALGLSYAIGRLMGLPVRMAILVACGNSICGNSAIAAVAPVIGARSDDVAASIAFTAVLGVAVVILLPFIGHALHLSGLQYGALAGLTVYAVPQVLAATIPFGAVALQIGTLVKLVRVLMLGPVCVALAFLAPRIAHEEPADLHDETARPQHIRLPLHQMVPWFIIGFLLMAAARSLALIPEMVVRPLALAATLLTTLSMAALGLGVDVRTVANAGMKVSATVTLSLVVLGAVSLALIRSLGLQ
jgi:uncharacterized integral membrane protein (TIGR00698 family)